MVAIPAGYDDLLERPLYGHLASIRPDGTIQVSPMWLTVTYLLHTFGELCLSPVGMSGEYVTPRGERCDA